MTRKDYAIFDRDNFVTNALLTDSEVRRFEADGLRCVRVIDGEGLPAFRGTFSGSGYVARRASNGGRWDRS